MNVLNQSIVLVLNRVWQAINAKTPQEVFPMLATGAATALDIQGEDIIGPVSWEQWLLLPVRAGDRSVQTIRGPVRIPAVIVLCNYAKMPKKRPKLSSRGVAQRDGNRCQYSGRLLKPEDGSLDHVVPRSRGGKNSWENVVWAAKELNFAKANRTPEECGLKLLSKPRQPGEITAAASLRNSHDVPEWELFLHK